MKKNQIRLTENELRELIKESVNNVLEQVNNENSLNDAMNLLYDIYDNIEYTMSVIPQSERILRQTLNDVQKVRKIIQINW